MDLIQNNMLTSRVIILTDLIQNNMLTSCDKPHLIQNNMLTCDKQILYKITC